MISDDRYEKMIYRRCGNSGLLLPAISLGLLKNFGKTNSYDNSKEVIISAFNHGINHFDLANNYGNPPGSAECTLGRILREELIGYRDELLISTKAGYTMWKGPYGDWGSRKHLLSSLNQSLKRLGLEYVDIFYSHRRDPNTPLEETMGALATAVHQGKALYVGISNYNALDTKKAVTILKNMGVPCLIHQPSYSLLNRRVEDGLIDLFKKEGMGAIAFGSLEQGLLTSKGLDEETLKGARALDSEVLKGEETLDEVLHKIQQLNEVAAHRGQTLAQMSIAWTLREGGVTSTLIGASSKEQIEENVKALDNLEFTEEELTIIERILNKLI